MNLIFVFILDPEKYKRYTPIKNSKDIQQIPVNVLLLLTRILTTEYSEGETLKVLYNNIL